MRAEFTVYYCYRCQQQKHKNDGKKQEALLSQTDRAMRCVSRNLVHCRTTVETSCTKNPQQFEVVELEGYSRPTCNVRTTPRQSWCDLQARPLTSFVDTPSAPSPSTCRGEIIFKTRVWDGVSEGRTLIFEATRISLSNGVGQVEISSHSKNPGSIRPSALIELRLVTDGQTDGHRHIIHGIYRARITSCVKMFLSVF